MYTEDQYKEFADKMETKYPKMFKPGYGGFAIGAGWWSIIESLCFHIQSHIDWRNGVREKLLVDNPHNHTIPDEVEQVVVTQIKEKFGGLRFYYDGGDEKIDGFVDMAESWASKTCEVCGNVGKSRPGGWIRTLCDEHAKKDENDSTS